MDYYHWSVATSTRVTTHREVLEMISESAKRFHPKQTILLLHDEAKNNLINISEVLIQPLGTYEKSYSSSGYNRLKEEFI